MILITLLGSMALLQPVQAYSDPASWYTTVPGVLGTDYYTLYPFAQKSLTFGFSQFGEMIDANKLTGLLYNGLDPFANSYVPEYEWNEGWLINLTYTYGDAYRNVWAFALFSDSYSTSSIGGNWQWAPSPDSVTVLGGRKVGGYAYNVANPSSPTPIGYASTAPVTVLYNGPRSYVALCNNTIGEDANTPLVSVLLTFIFDKVKKNVMVVKDVKLLDTRKFAGTMQVEFGDRGQWDLGNTVKPLSYAHFYLNQSNSYMSGWQPFYGGSNPAYYDLAQIISSSTPGYVGFEAFWPTLTSRYVEGTPYIDRTTMLSSMSTYTANFVGNGGASYTISAPNPTPCSYPIGSGVWSNQPMVFINGKITTAYTWNPTTYTVTFNSAQPSGTAIFMVYKHAVLRQDMSAEPSTPYVIGEWTFDLTWANTTASTNQFRGVTVYGMVDTHDATYSPGVIDREAWYQLNETFAPWDLVDAVSKNTDRWVEYSANPINATYFTTTNSPVIASGSPDGWNLPNSMWDGYWTFADKVEDLTAGTVLNRYNGDYGFKYLSNGTGNFTGLNPNHYYKFLYSTFGPPAEGRYEWGVVGRDASQSVDSAGLSMISVAFEDNFNYEVGYGLAGADMYNPVIANQMPWVMSKMGTADTWAGYYYSGTDYRTGLRDDWCTTWPIASSNMIGVGGPLANVLLYYGNDFETAFFGMGQFTGYATWQNAIVPLTCWSAPQRGYTDSNTTGYAVISTYMDINGTVVFLVWGNWGRDTYYVSKWFWDSGSILQIAPEGLTSIIVKITYKSYAEGYKPTSFSIVESLGTISETLWAGGGGIHPDP
jgi:hypothetical protein